MRVVVIGAGSLGSAMGGTLALAGHDVALVTRNAAHVAAMGLDGLRLDDGERLRRAQVRATTGYDDLPVAELAIVLVKSFDTEDAVRAARPVIGDDTVVLTLQNGVGCEETIASVVGEERVVAGRTFVGGRIVEPGLVEYGIDGRHTTIGELDGTRSERIEAIAAAFTSAGMTTDVSDDIRVMMWEKLFVNVATGAWSAVTGLPYGELSIQPDVERMAIATVAEAIEVAQALGIAATTTDPEVPWRRAWEGLPDAFRASMLQSIDKGSRTEVDVMHGAVCRGGRDAGVPTPINDTLWAAVRGMERRLELERDGAPAPPLASRAGWSAYPELPTGDPAEREVASLGALADLDLRREDDPRRMSVSVSEFAVLDNGERITLHADRGYTSRTSGDDVWEHMTVDALAAEVLAVVLPDSDDDPEPHPWEWLAELVGVHGIEVTPDELRTLPYAVVLSERLRRRLPDAG